MILCHNFNFLSQNFDSLFHSSGFFISSSQLGRIIFVKISFNLILLFIWRKWASILGRVQSITNNSGTQGSDVQLSDLLSLQGLTGPDGPAGKDGPAGEPVSVSKSFELTGTPRMRLKMRPIECYNLFYFRLLLINQLVKVSH